MEELHYLHSLSSSIISLEYVTNIRRTASFPRRKIPPTALKFVVTFSHLLICRMIFKVTIELRPHKIPFVTNSVDYK